MTPDNIPLDEDEVLVAKARALIVREQVGATWILQRGLGVGFAKACHLIDILETRGVLGPPMKTESREVLVEE